LPRRKRQSYSRGELNRMIDSVVHPIAKYDVRGWVLDSVLHGVVEQDLESTVKKFLRYNVPKIIQQLAGSQNKPRRKRRAT
jgi:hypothetical protein